MQDKPENMPNQSGWSLTGMHTVDVYSFGESNVRERLVELTNFARAARERTHGKSFCSDQPVE